jgi:hypothetical protein
MNSTASKALTTILTALILVASVGASYLILSKLTNTPAATARASSPFTEVSLTAASAISAAPVPSNDSNWAGYIASSDLQNPQPTVTAISASWTVPAVTPSAQNDTYAAVWIGIGGYYDNTLIQTGTEQDSIGGQGDYTTWYELLPAFAVTIDTMVISPGDQMNASIQLVDAVTDTWSISIEDLTTSQAFQDDFTYASSQLSAEWIVERPLAGRRLSTLANIDTVTFTNCQATVGSQSGNISSFPALESIMYQTVDQNADGVNQLAAVSDLADGGTSFTVETSQEVIPELPVWAVLPLVMGTGLFAAAVRKRQTRSRNGAGTRAAGKTVNLKF